MQQPESKHAIIRDRYGAVLLDLDGVITATVSIHANGGPMVPRSSRRHTAFFGRSCPPVDEQHAMSAA